MTKRIYVATDYLRPAGEPLELGALLSRSAGAPLALVVVRPYPPLTPEVREGSFREALKRETESRLVESVEPLRQRGLEVTGEAVVSTSVPRGLQQVSERADAGVLVVGPTRHGPLGRLFAGTTASHLLHGASCPVAIPPRGFRAPEHGPLRIGVAYDGAAEAYVALTEAAALARTIGARPRVVAIAEPPTSFVTAGVPGYDYGRLAQESRQDLQQRLRRAVDAQPADLAIEHEPTRALAWPSWPRRRARWTCWCAVRAAMERFGACCWAASRLPAPDRRGQLPGGRRSIGPRARARCARRSAEARRVRRADREMRPRVCVTRTRESRRFAL